MPRFAVAAAMLTVLLATTPGSARAAELLTNSGFEAGISPWETSHGQLTPVDTPVHGGSSSARLTSSGLQSHEVYRFVPVAPGESYQLSAWALLDHPAVDRVFLRISWFNSTGGLVSQSDSPWLTIPSPQYEPLATGWVTSPLSSVSARVGARVQVSGPAQVHLDDFSFTGPIAPAPTPVPTAPPTPQPTSTPITNPPPSTQTPSPTPRSSPASTASEEPEVFDQLTNGSFEITRADGTAFAWKDVGADLRVASHPVIDGALSLSLTSRTSSTKWAYQTVRVKPGQFYAASGQAWRNGLDQAFLRVSWYRSGDGSGQAIDSADSDVSTGDGFQHLATGPIQAPAEALTAKVRLMLRPGSNAEAVVYFDAVTFGVTSDRPSAADGDDEGGSGVGAQAGSSSSKPRGSSAGANSESDAEARVERYPLGFANVQPQPTAVPSTVSTSRDLQWLAIVAILIGGAVVTFAGYLEWSHSKRERGRTA